MSAVCSLAIPFSAAYFQIDSLSSGRVVVERASPSTGNILFLQLLTLTLASLISFSLSEGTRVGLPAFAKYRQLVVVAKNKLRWSPKTPPTNLHLAQCTIVFALCKGIT